MRVMEYYTPTGFYEPQNATARKIIDFEHLAVGWHFGGGVPSSSATTRRALAILDDLLSLGFTSTNAFPGQDGEIALTADAQNNSVEIIVEVDDTYTVVQDENDREIERAERISLVKAKGLLAKISGEIWNSSTYSIQSTMISPKGDFKALLSGIRRVGAYQSFQWSVLNKAQRISVHTVGNTIAA